VLRAAGADARTTTAGRLRAHRSFTYITSDDLRGRGIVRFGVPIARLDHYELETDHDRHYYTFAVSNDERLADIRSYAE
jgi:hypothetical protein